MLSTGEAKLLADISGKRAFENVSILVSPWERVSGSQAEREGAEKVRELLSPYVDSCELEGVEVTTYHRNKGKLEVISPINVSIPCEVNPVTGSGKGEGILIDIVGGTKRDFEKLEAEVKSNVVIAMVTGSPAGISGNVGLVAREAKHRGVACLVYHLQGREDDIMSVHGLNVDLPILSISSDSAAELRRILSEHGEVKVSFESNLAKAPGTSYNVVGTIMGSQFPGEFIYITSHHDTWFQGANDNNTTTACLLEVANLLRERRPKRSVRFVIHGSEESGIEVGRDVLPYDRGSFGYSEQHRSELEGEQGGVLPICIINGEMLGYTPRAQIESTPELLNFVKEVMANLEEEHGVSEAGPAWMSSDHLCYHTLGVPTIYLIPGPDPGTDDMSSYFRLYHTERDDLEHVSVEALAGNAKLLALLVARLDAAEIQAHSLEGLVEAAGRGMEHVPNSSRIGELLKERSTYCSETLSREDRTKNILEFVRIVNRSIYGFIGGVFTQKFVAIDDTVTKLRQAYQFIDTEENMERVREVLLSITGAAQVENISPEVIEELNEMRKGSPLLNRLSNFSLNVRPVLDEIDQGNPKQAILSSLESYIEASLETAKDWGIAFEEALSFSRR